MRAEWIALLVALPLLAAFLLQPLSMVAGSERQRRVYWIAPATIMATLALSAMLGESLSQQPISMVMGGFVVPMGINFYLDGLSWGLLVALQFSLLLLWPPSHSIRQQVLMLLLAASATGMVLSGDLFNLYVFYELLAVATFGLVAINKSRAAATASFRYLILSGLGAVLILSGIALIYHQTGTLNLAHLAQLVSLGTVELPLAAFLLMLVGFGVKAELFGVNGWVPEVYGVISPRLSALLAGVISKLAVLVILRVVLLLFPQPEAAQALLWLGILGVASGEFAAWRSRDLRRMLSFSSIGQLGMILIAFSLSLEVGLFVGIVLSLHHLLVKAGLFLLTEDRFGRWGIALFILFSLSLVGVPPLPGFWAKFSLLNGLWSVGGWENHLALVLFLIVTVVEASYLFRVVQQYQQGAMVAPVAVDGAQRSWIDATAVSAILALLLLWTTVQIQEVADKVEQVAVQAADRGQLIATVLGEKQ